jgi:hypothetical protein
VRGIGLLDAGAVWIGVWNRARARIEFVNSVTNGRAAGDERARGPDLRCIKKSAATRARPRFPVSSTVSVIRPDGLIAYVGCPTRRPLTGSMETGRVAVALVKPTREFEG